MKGKAGVMVAVLAATGVLAGAALAQGPGRGRPGGARGKDALAEYLGLSTEQREQLRAMRVQHREDDRPLREEGRRLHEKLRTALEAKSPDPAAVGAAMIEVQQHRQKMEASREAFQGRMKAQLTPEQQTRLEAFEAARDAQRGPRRRGRGGKGHPPEADFDGPAVQG
jgi:Spy/CpxP family protein refolding chaperone